MRQQLRDQAKAAIKGRGITVCEFCRAFGSRGSTAEKWLYGVIDNPRIATIEMVFEKLGLKLSL